MSQKSEKFLRCSFSFWTCDAPVPGRRKSQGAQVGSCSATMQAAGLLWSEIREVSLLRYVFAVSESDELTNYGDQVAQAQRSIHTNISRNHRQSSEIRNSESRKKLT